MGFGNINNLSISNFKKLPRAFLVTLLVIALSYLVELFVLPIHFFTFRVWEAVIATHFRFALPGPFYPNMKVTMIEKGDLGYRTKFAVKREVEWQTDCYGYRKSNTDNPHHPIIIVGDSSIVGTGLTQQQILSEVLERNLRMSVYPLAPADINTFLNSDRFKKNLPKILILGITERNILTLPEVHIDTESRNNSLIRRKLKAYLEKHLVLTTYLDRFSKSVMANYLMARLVEIQRAIIMNFISPIFIKSHRKSLEDHLPKMLFLEGEEANKDIPQKEVQRVVQLIKTYDNILKERRIRFIFLPIPNKESIYYKYLPNRKKQMFLGQLIPQLRMENIETINTQVVFEQTYLAKKTLLYYPDDSHWNKNGVRITAELVKKIILSR